MQESWKSLVLRNTEATDAKITESVQTLWSGYGEIFRIQLIPESLGTLIVKQVIPPTDNQHPRGWNSDRSNLRKLKSYEVEAHWYNEWSARCNRDCRVAKSIASDQADNQSWIVMEDLDASGYSIRHSQLTPQQTRPCLSWLANFHANFLNSKPGESPTGLWPVGTYWHLETRPDEFNAMQEGALKDIAADLDQLLNECEFQTLVHGDAKVANFCFDSSGSNVAAVDFQYVGAGCGMKDVAYFFGSCFNESECAQYVPELLDYYFEELKNSVDKSTDYHSLEREWRALFAPAWTDFYRFLLGWMPEHAKIHGYTEKLAKETLEQMSFR